MGQPKKVISKRVILACVEYSAASVPALSSAADLVRSDPNAELHIVHVVSPPYPTMHRDGRTPDRLEAFNMIGLDAQNELPWLYSQNISDLGPRVTGHLCLGRPDREIVLLAAKIRADLIVIGTHGRTTLERVFLGSVAERVLRAASCTVLTVRPKERTREPPCAGAHLR